MVDKGEAAALGEVLESLKSDYPGLAGDEVDAMVARARDDFAGRPIRDFVPLLVERRIRSQLAAS